MTRLTKVPPAFGLRFATPCPPLGHWSLPFGGATARYVFWVPWVPARLNTTEAAPVAGMEPAPLSTTLRHVFACRGLLVVPAQAVWWLARVSHIRMGAML